MLDGVTEWAIRTVEALGYVGVAMVVALENLFPPIPSEIVLPLAGFVSATGPTSLAGMVLAATAGSLIGAFVLYGAAGAIGPVRLHGIVRRFGRWLGFEEADLTRSEQWFDDRATRAVLICRCIPLLRSLISIPAGFRRMPLGPFAFYTAVGSLIWNLVLITGGHLLGENWRRAGEPVEVLQQVVVYVLIAGMAWFIWRRMVLPRLRRAD